MEKRLTSLTVLCVFLHFTCLSQVDTTYIHKNGTPFGALDLRIAKSPTNYYYLAEGTYAFRESSPGVRTNTFYDMTSWDSGPYIEGHLMERTSTGDKFVMNYRLLIPQDYNASYAEGYPLAVMMHGYGERGNCEENRCYHADRNWSPVTNNPPAPTNPDHLLMNNDHNLLHGGAKHLSAVNRAAGRLPDDPSLDEKSFPGFVLFPQNLNGWDHFAVQDAIRIIRLLLKKYNIDQDRVYLEGLSNGGHGVYEALKRAPWLFASAIAMSAVDDGFINSQGVAASIAHIPLWIFQGGRDVNPWPAKTLRYIQQFRNVGADIRYTLYPELGHGTWNKAFNEPDFFTWMLGTNKSDIHSFEGSTFICSDQGTRLELARGYFAYQWEFNGQVIQGADSAVLYAKTPGTYRARFSRVANPTESQWNQWSKPLVLAQADPPVATLQQVSTVHLKDLNGKNEAILQSAEPHGHYYWYKDGQLLDLPGSEDDTVIQVKLASSYGNGAYSLVVSDYGCRSEPSAALQVFFSDSAPVNLDAPSNFEGVSLSPSENALTWTDASDGESGFEVWRRTRLSNGTSWGQWALVGIAPANTTTFDDTAVEPTASYQYKIRAVGPSGRSEYTPSGSGGLVVQTLVDNEPPSAPSNVTVTRRGVDRYFITWSPATDNTRIREYAIFYNGDSVSTASADTTFTLTGLAPNTKYQVSVRAIDLSKNLGPASESIEVSTFFSGLFYEHSTGSWTTLDAVDWSWAEFTGAVPSFTLAPRTQDDYYNFTFDGYLLITQPGEYTFRTTSSDGSRLWIDGNVVVDNDGIHEIQTVEGSPVSLDEGPHRIYLRFFEHTQSDSLYVEYSGPDTGNEWTEISHTVLKSDPSIITSVGNPDNGAEDSFIVDVYPNPASQDEINVLVRTVLPVPVRIRLIDLTGSSLFDQVFHPEEIGQGVRVTPHGTMQTGMYVITVTQGGITVREKLVVKR
jgi:chitodextrinase/pimeloyl-ACP methyl ester carboxylesterase